VIYQQESSVTYVIFLRLAPTATANLQRPGVMDAVAEAARAGAAPSLDVLTRLGQPAVFANLLVQRLTYLLSLRAAGILRAAGPFADLQGGMYICNVPNERDARDIMEEDPFVRAGLIESSYTIHQWCAAI